ncbi:MAG: hypothetical protein ACYCY2_07210 [Acidithiobacillus ferriphilus]
MTIDERKTRLAELEEELARKREQEKRLVERIEFLKNRRDDDDEIKSSRLDMEWY